MTSRPRSRGTSRRRRRRRAETSPRRVAEAALRIRRRRRRPSLSVRRLRASRCVAIIMERATVGVQRRVLLVARRRRRAGQERTPPGGRAAREVRRERALADVGAARQAVPQQRLPVRPALERHGVADDHVQRLRARHRHVEAPGTRQETEARVGGDVSFRKFALRVRRRRRGGPAARHRADEHHLLLLALVVVHRADAHGSQPARAQRACVGAPPARGTARSRRRRRFEA